MDDFIDIVLDAETTGLLDETSIDYSASPYQLKSDFEVHCVVVEERQTGEIIAFYDGDTYELDGEPYVEDIGEYTYTLEDYEAVEYTHKQLHEFKDYVLNNKIRKVIGHNIINFDLLVFKLVFGMDYEVLPDKWCGKKVDISDTLVQAKTQNADRFGGNSLDNLSKMAKKHQKIQFRKSIPKDDRFKVFAADMLYYNIIDVRANAAVKDYLDWEAGDWDWKQAIQIEKAIAEIATRQEHRGFAFDYELAKQNVAELDKLMEECRVAVEPLLPPRPATKKFLGDHTPPATQVLEKGIKPPKSQFKGNGEPTASLIKFAAKMSAEIIKTEADGGDEYKLVCDDGEYLLPLDIDENFRIERTVGAHMVNFVEKHGGTLDGTVATLYGKEYQLPMPVEPIKTHMVATIDDTTHIKQWLVGLGWQPSEYKTKDITTKSGPLKQKRTPEEIESAVDAYVVETMASTFRDDRMAHMDAQAGSAAVFKRKIMKIARKRKCHVLTNPTFTVGQDKRDDPNLQIIAEKFPHVKKVVEYLTYKHRRNSILGGGLDWEDEEEAEKGYLANYREDSRIATPVDTCGAACVVADTLIVTDNGTVPITEVSLGDLVLTHEGVYKPVLDRIFNGIKPIAEVSFSNGNCVTSTLNHPYLTPDGWKRLDQLVVGDEVYTYQERESWCASPLNPDYLVSSWGRVVGRSGWVLKTMKRKALWNRASIDIQLPNGGKVRKGVGGLVLEAFVSARPEGKECCHRDGNPMNNHLNNLYWGTSKENSADAKKHGRSLKASRTGTKLSESQVNEIKEHFLHFGYTWGDDTKLGKKYGVGRSMIWGIRNGRRWRDGNTHNMYKEGYKLTKVVNVVDKGVAPTFDITVEDHHSYVANGMVTHNTSRMTHKVVANVPRPSSLYGAPMRRLFGVADKCTQLGYDFSGLESRIEGHYCYSFDDEDKSYANLLLQDKPNSVHCVMARTVSEILGQEFLRDYAKSVRYGIVYGAQEPKVAKTIGSDLATGKIVFNSFWDGAKPLKLLKEHLVKHWESNDKKFIKGIDGRKVPTRAAHAILNTLFQSAGVICAKYTAIVHDRLLKKHGKVVDFFKDDWYNADYCQQMIMYHDETQLEEKTSNFTFKRFDSKEEANVYREQTEGFWSEPFNKKDKWWVAHSLSADLLKQAVDKTTEHFNLKVPLSVEYAVGKNWAECH